MPTILIVDTHSVFRKGIRKLIEDRIECSRIRETSNLQYSDLEGLVDLVLINSGCLAERSWQLLDDARERNLGLHCAIISTSKIRSDVLNCLSAGFHGYVHKFQPDQEWLTAITDLLSGRIYVPPWLADVQDGDSQISPPANGEFETVRLTPRQKEILPLLSLGMSNKDIARRLKLAEGQASAIRQHLSRIGRSQSNRGGFCCGEACGAAKLVGRSNELSSRPLESRIVGD